MGLTKQSMTIITGINNRGTGTLNLTPDYRFTVEANDDDPPTIEWQGRMINWKPDC